jgi:hypothetical protein
VNGTCCYRQKGCFPCIGFISPCRTSSVESAGGNAFGPPAKAKRWTRLTRWCRNAKCGHAINVAKDSPTRQATSIPKAGLSIFQTFPYLENVVITSVEWQFRQSRCFLILRRHRSLECLNAIAAAYFEYRQEVNMTLHSRKKNPLLYILPMSHKDFHI